MPGITCLFAHFSANGRVCEHIHRYIGELSALGIRIAFISNSPVSAADRSRLGDNGGVYRIAERENKGNDFGAWQWALANNVVPEDADHLLLTNDSIFGPLFPLGPLFQKMCNQPPVDFWGLTDSYQGGWHIQTYFICLNRKAFTSKAFKEVMARDYARFDKRRIIEQGEIGLSQALVSEGFSGTAYFPYKRLDPDAVPADLKNPTHFFWDRLIRDEHFPFIKKELILFNPEQLGNVAEVFSFLEATTGYAVADIKECILDHLQARTSAGGARLITAEISVLCHMYYPATIYAFLSKLAVLKSPRTRLVINLSAALARNRHFLDILTTHFPDAMLLFTPDQGRDIGGKLAAIDVLLKCGMSTSYSLVIHDKNSPHTPTGQDWSKSLMRIIDPGSLPKVFDAFENDPATGIVTSSHFIKNEFDPDRNDFTSTSSMNINRYLGQYELALSDRTFAAGTIFWIRTGILSRFFGDHPPLSVRKSLERGNALDFAQGTNIHAWERLFSFIAHAQGFKTRGVH